MMKVVPTYWMKHPNFGDDLTPYIIRKLTGLEAAFITDSNMPKYMVTGSILSDPMASSCVVWGTGIAWKTSEIVKPLKILAVRGPLTKARLDELKIPCPAVYGDPCLLLPIFYFPEIKKKYKLGIIPHIIDFEQAVNYYSDDADVLVINLLDGIEKVVDQVLSCEKTVSSSLHGVIVSHAYGVDSLWIELSEKVIGDGTKFNDYLLSVGMRPYLPLNVRKRVSVDKLIAAVPKNKIAIDLRPLYQSCPFTSI